MVKNKDFTKVLKQLAYVMLTGQASRIVSGRLIRFTIRRQSLASHQQEKMLSI